MMHVFVHVGICNVSELYCNDDQRIHKQTKVCSPNYSIPSSATHSLLRSSALTAIYAMELRNFDTPRPHLMTLTRVNQCAQSWSSISYAFCVKFQPYKGTFSCTMRDTKSEHLTIYSDRHGCAYWDACLGARRDFIILPDLSSRMPASDQSSPCKARQSDRAEVTYDLVLKVYILK